MGAKWIDTDRGWDRIKQTIDRARHKPHVVVGIFGALAAKDHGGQPNVKIAASHEYGADIDHPGGTAYKVIDGRAVFVSNADAKDTNLPRTKPHKIQIPERSFIRRTVDLQQKKIMKLVSTLQGKVLEGKLTTAKSLDILGLFVKGEIQKRISQGIPPPLKKSTLRRKIVGGKAGNKPLINTGQLRASIDSQVRKA